MQSKNVSQLEIGDVLFDMHDGFGRRLDSELAITEPHAIKSRVVIRAPNGSDFIKRAVIAASGRDYTYTNKYLVVVGLEYNEDKTVVKAAWSYDDMSFGLMRIEVPE